MTRRYFDFHPNICEIQYSPQANRLVDIQRKDCYRMLQVTRLPGYFFDIALSLVILFIIHSFLS